MVVNLINRGRVSVDLAHEGCKESNCRRMGRGEAGRGEVWELGYH